MNAAHMHLLVNHLPVTGSIFAILLLVWSLARKNTDIARAALGLFVIAAITGLAAYFTGARLEAKNRLNPDAIHPARRAGVPRPTAAPDLAFERIDIGGHDIRLNLVVR